MLTPTPNRLVRSLLTCLLLLASNVLAVPVAAEVVVLSNRTTSPVKCTLVEKGKLGRVISIARGDANPVFYSGSLKIRYRDGKTEREYELSHANAYFFTYGLGDGSLHFERIGLSESAPAATGPTRRGIKSDAVPTISVKLLVDDDEPTHRRIWESRLRKRLAAASDVLGRHSGVRLRVVEVATWDSDDSHNNFGLSLREFEREVSPKPARVAIGFSSQYQIARGRIHMGGTRGILHPYILLKERSPNIRETERLELLVHELGHFLGASHSPEPHSVMRPVITGGQQRAAGAHIQFDPVNALLMAMIGEELRRPGVRSLLDISGSTKARMLQIYGVLSEALPEDPAAKQYQAMLRRASSVSMLNDIRLVLNHLVQVAKSRDEQPDSREGNSAPAEEGDALTNRYVREAATMAQRLNPENASKALLLAMGIFMDDTETLRTFPATKRVVSTVEPAQAHRERLRVMGTPTMRGRSDLVKHFFVSAHTTVIMGSPATRGAGLAKELLDARRGTGFSFADMAANRAGIVFAERLLQGKITLAEVARDFSTHRYLPPIADLLEGLGSEELEDQFGGEGNEALGAELGRIEKLILELPVYRR